MRVAEVNVAQNFLAAPGDEDGLDEVRIELGVLLPRDARTSSSSAASIVRISE